MSDQNPIHIHLDLSRSPRAFTSDQCLWHKDLGRIYRRIADHIALIGEKTFTQKDGERPPNLAIAIFGPSGSGKSSLLETLHFDVQNARGEQRGKAGFLGESGVLARPEHQSETKQLPKDLHESLAALPVMHPDTFAEDDHFLYAFLARALKADRRSEGLEAETGEEAGVLTSVQQQFQELSDFLRVLDPAEKSHEYDPLGLSLERMERHTSGLLLRGQLSKFIDALRESLRSKVVLLLVDDVDMNPLQMVEVLKIYQSYLIHPRLIPIFTFTDRTAEEVLRVHYAEYLTGGAHTFAEPGETGPRLKVSERLALQYLARCFPVRNRIRLGPASARVQNATFRVSYGNPPDPDDVRSQDQPVFDLLRAANYFLFGHHDWNHTHDVSASLRPSTLRRQLHVMDTLVEAGIDKFIVNQFRKPGDGLHHSQQPCDCYPFDNLARQQRELCPDCTKKLRKRPHWALAFHRASWALLNVHRDVLRELDLFMEDLYSWSPHALRRVVLDTLLAQEIDVRRSLLRRWRDRSDSRRSQILSLLAAVMFKPWTPVEEPMGDDAYAYALGGNTESDDEGKTWLYPRTVLLWFLELTIGFYMPLALARPRAEESILSDSEQRQVIGIGWGIESGPVNAVRDADARQNMLPTGICFIDDKKLSEKLGKGSSGEFPNELFGRVWCFYGFSRGRFWAAVSFWRGLGLIARLLDWQRRTDTDHSLSEKEKEKRLQILLRHHILRGMVPAGLLGRVADERRLNVAFAGWDRWRTDSEADETLKDMEGLLSAWLGKEEKKGQWTAVGKEGERAPEFSDVIYPMPCSEGTTRINGTVNTDDARFGWRRSFLRRLHGDDILGDLWQQLASTYIEDQEIYSSAEGDVKKSRSSRQKNNKPEKSSRWNACIALIAWTRVLLDYWRGVYNIQKLLRSCPLLRPLITGPGMDELRRDAMEKWSTGGDFQTKALKAKSYEIQFDSSLTVKEFSEKSAGRAHALLQALPYQGQKGPRVRKLRKEALAEKLIKHWKIIGALPNRETRRFSKDSDNPKKGGQAKGDQEKKVFLEQMTIDGEYAASLHQVLVEEILEVARGLPKLKWLWELQRVEQKRFEIKHHETSYTGDVAENEERTAYNINLTATDRTS